jgi:hypothetical protein
MSTLRSELHANDWLRHSLPLLADDWIPSLQHFAPLQPTRSRLSARHEPGRATRHYWLCAPPGNALALELRFTLCLEGWKDTVEVVFGTLENHQGHLPRPITDTTKELGIGDIGFAWGYREARTLDALVFARYNLVVFLRRYQPEIGIVEYAQAIDQELRALATCAAYESGHTGAFADAGDKRPVSVRVNQRLDLGSEPEAEHWFYHASLGSVNRDPANPRQRYYRAPHLPARAQLWAYVLGKGVLARREALDVEVRP